MRLASACLAAFAAVPASAATEITFTEVAYTGPLTNQYAAFGINFALSGTISTARAYNDARDTFDARGFVGTPERGNPNVIFDSLVDQVSFDYATIGKSFFFNAFDASDTIIETLLISAPATVVTNASAAFTVNGIKRIQLIDIDQQVGISTLRFTLQNATAPVPEPASWAMMIAGFGAVGVSMRRRKSLHPQRA
jgi:hypothetical protein